MPSIYSVSGTAFGVKRGFLDGQVIANTEKFKRVCPSY